MEQKFLIVKDNDTKEIRYFDYDKINGYNLTAKQNVHFEDAIDISRIIIIKPSFVEKLVTKKINLKFEAFLTLVTSVYEDEDETGESYNIVLDEAQKLRTEILNKYKKYISDEKLNLMLRKIEILEDEIKLRNNIILQSFERQIDKNKGRGR